MIKNKMKTCSENKNRETEKHLFLKPEIPNNNKSAHICY